MPDASLVAVVTGANRGLGRAAARLLAERGLRVVMTGRRAPALQQAVADLRREIDTQAHLVPHVLDVEAPASIDAFVRWTGRHLGRVDVLVNTAGVYLEADAGLFESTDAALDRSMAVHLYGPLRLTRALLPGMNARGYGRIVNVSSGSITATAGGGAVAYKISKAALGALTRIAAGEASGDVKVNAVDPGCVRPGTGGASAPRSPEQAAAGLVWAATLPADGPTGGFFFDGEARPW